MDFAALRNTPRCGNALLLARVREIAPRKKAVLTLGSVTYVARRVDAGVEIIPSRFKAMTYTVTGDDGSDCVAEFIHIDT